MVERDETGGIAREGNAEHRRAMMRGAVTALMIATIAVTGIVAVDRSGNDGQADTSTSLAGAVSSTTMPLTAPLATAPPASATTIVTPVSVSPTSAATDAPGTAASTSMPTAATSALPGTTLAVAPITPTGASTSAPNVDAAAYAVLDVTNGRWLAELQADEQRPVGSVMKLLTTYVVMQAGDPEHVVTVPQLELDPEESSIGLYPGEQLSRAVLLRAMLIVSANDAARSLAQDVGGSTDGFVGMMNTAAGTLGLDATVAANPIGLDADGAHSSARDMASLAALLMQDASFRATVARTSATLHGQTLPSTNAAFLTSYPGADGVKTGHTTNAGYCLAASATRDGRELIVVVLGSSADDARVAAASALLDWAFAQP